MLTAIGLGGPMAFAAMMVYLAAHAFIKASLFLSAGILLHRLRAIGERSLFAKGTSLQWTAVLWFLGALGLAFAPPFLSMIGEGGISKAAKEMGMPWVPWVCLLGGVLTSAAVLRVGMHTFLGWGTEPITDEAAQIGELPETATEDQRVFWYQYTPAAISVAVPVVLVFIPKWLSIVRNASAGFTRQAAMLHSTYTGLAVHATLRGWTIGGAALHGVLAFIVAGLLALTSVFRARVARFFRFGAFLESGFSPLRAVQSGHPGDYIFWITVGLATCGSVALLVLR